MQLGVVGGLEFGVVSLALVLDISNVSVGISVVGHGLETAIRESNKVGTLGKISWKSI